MGGEIPSLLIVDSLIRAIPNFIHPDSYWNETFSGLNFDYDSYTRPRDFDGSLVPEILLSGNHLRIKEWRIKNSLSKIEKRVVVTSSKKELPNLNQWRLSKIVGG